ncbi:HAMP domain-containing sensor histidine kinase [uncultured Parvibaculum sp.]|uniref:PAS domain-containing sensor histidine kinase n=1 Tax=uncultured Parvibaculum sp. TaxID=291828 RepID=UPI0030D7BDDF
MAAEAPADLAELPLRDPTTGKIRWIEASAINLLDDPAVSGILINIRDISHRKRTENELRHQFNVLQKLATGASLAEIMIQLALGAEETTPDSRAAVFLVDGQGDLTTCAAPSMPAAFADSIANIWPHLKAGSFGSATMNGEQIVVTDLQSIEMHGKVVADFSIAADIQTIWFQPILMGKGTVAGAFALYFRDNRWPSDADNDFLRGATNIAGITIERRRAEQNLRRATEAAELANRAKTKFLANMSHELRTPLNAIIGFSEIMREEMFGPVGTDVYKNYAADIHDSGRHLLSVIDDILDISKIEAGRYTLEESELDLNEVIAWSIELTRPKAQEKRLNICREAPPHTPHFMGDQRALRQILLNLLSNAIKFTPEDGAIHVGLEKNPEGGLTLYVRDNGAGIPPENLKEVVEPFAQVGDTTSRDHGGTGLGLSITRSLAEMHGGSLTLESELGCGTRVAVNLPASRLIQTDQTPKTETAANG